MMMQRIVGRRTRSLTRLGQESVPRAAKRTLATKAYDWEETIDRKFTRSIKYDRYAVDRDRPEMRYKDVIPMWVADMDFRAPAPMLKALHERIDHGIFGYTGPDYKVKNAICDYHARVHGVEGVKAEHLVFLPGLVVGLNLLARMAARRNEALMTATPVYPPFLSCAKNAETGSVPVPLKWRDDVGHYSFDFDAMERAADASLAGNQRVGVFVLCNPHNPMGHAYTREELKALADFCMRRDIVVCADEIHCDLVLGEHRHVPFASVLSETQGLERHLIAFHSPSKTYNLAGYSTSYAIIPGEDLRLRFKREMPGITADITTLGYTVLEEACADREGGFATYRGELVSQIASNVDRLRSFTETHLAPYIKFEHSQEATYLAWLDARELAAATQARNVATWIEREAGVGLNDGAPFGEGNMFQGYVRMNLACPRATLDEGLDRLARAVESVRAKQA
ncbi:Aminotransferase, putative [Hondaea fermentalgiana]|uniref:cysteine-S-conjugate beta-lyase n=1 Tax=Hondaea fermentalgiana TaxID=2315210 RepID=A0A2R5GLE1_9STRA|nr:Aminotransferase, putative [Hondaea fermentalgiana]|eukprot:GBG31697.1 Aminotransferase, putative [Hondaea fermentalgiana]